MHRLARILFAFAVFGGLASGVGCGVAGKRPVVRDDCGDVLSQLIFPASRSEITLPLELDHGMLVTDAVRINGRPVGRMMIDTGAVWTMIDRTTATRLGITEDQLWQRREKRDTATGGAFHIASLDIGDVGFRNHVVGVTDLSSVGTKSVSIAGVLGGDLLGALPYTFDYERKTLTLYSRADFKPPRGAAEHRLRVNRSPIRGSFYKANPDAGQPMVDGRIDDVAARILLDTGAAASVVLYPWFVEKHPRFVIPDGKVVANVGGAAGPRGIAGRQLRQARVDHVDALGARFQSGGTATVLSAKPEDDAGRDPDSAVIGVQYLCHGRLTFDYAANRIWVEWRTPPMATSRPSTAPSR